MWLQITVTSRYSMYILLQYKRQHNVKFSYVTVRQLPRKDYTRWSLTYLSIFSQKNRTKPTTKRKKSDTTRSDARRKDSHSRWSAVRQFIAFYSALIWHTTYVGRMDGSINSKRLEP